MGYGSKLPPIGAVLRGSKGRRQGGVVMATSKLAVHEVSSVSNMKTLQTRA